MALDAVGKNRDALVAELRRALFKAEDIRSDTGNSAGGDFIRVVHIPSGTELMHQVLKAIRQLAFD